jgi:hypothetical protein
MSRIKFVVPLVLAFLLASCDRLDPSEGKALSGTETAIVGLYIDKDGYPQASVEKVKVFPGQKIIFAGPDKFEIIFKDKKSPTGRMEASSENGIVVIEIPLDIFEREQREAKATDVKELVYKYGIRVNGKLTDPEINVGRR